MTNLSTTNVNSPMDFGSGSVVLQNSHCLRHTKLPTDCDICLTSCPVSALVETNERITARESCIKCGLCMELCPVDAIQPTRANANMLSLQLMAATLRDDSLTLCCSQAAATLPTELRSRVMELPCLASLGPELWFFALSEAGIVGQAGQSDRAEQAGKAVQAGKAEQGDRAGQAGKAVQGNRAGQDGARLENGTGETGQSDGADGSGLGQPPGLPVLPSSTASKCHVFLPTGICAGCLINAAGTAEELYSSAIDVAETWSGNMVDLLSSAVELANSGKKGLLQSIQASEDGNRREVFENLLSSFKQSWNQAGDSLGQGQGSQKLKQIVKQRERNRQLTGVNLVDDASGGSKIGVSSLDGAHRSLGPGLAGGGGGGQGVTAPKLSSKRKTLITAMQDVPETADAVSVLVSATVYSQCSGCGNCVDACPLGARRMVNGNSTILFSDLSPETGPAAAQVGYVDPLKCTGCSACIQHCPTGACVYRQITGTALLKLLIKHR